MSLDSLQSQLDSEILAHQATKSALAALQLQQSSFQTWALSLESQIDHSNLTLSTKIQELEAVKRQLEALNRLSKSDERDAWNSKQLQHESDLKSLESQHKTQHEAIQKALNSAENECIEKESLYKSCNAELQVMKEFFQKKEATLTVHLAELTAENNNLKTEIAKKDHFERNFINSETEKKAIIEENVKLQTEISILSSKLKAAELENLSLQETVRRQCQEKAKSEGELMTQILKSNEIAKIAELNAENAVLENKKLVEKYEKEIEKRENEMIIERKKQEKYEEMISNWNLFYEDCRAYLQSETPSETMERYQRDLTDYRAQLGKCQVSLSKYEQMIEVGKEKLKALEMVVEVKEREVDVLRMCLKTHKIPVPDIPEGTGLGGTGRGSARGSVSSKKPQVTNDPCACRLF